MKKRIPWNKGLTKETDERIRKISEYLRQSNAMKEKHHTPEAKAKIAAASRKCWQDPEYRKKIIENTKNNWTNPEYRELMSNSAKKQWENPEYRKFRKSIAKRQRQDPEFLERRSKSSKKKWKDPDYRKRVIEGVSRNWQDPEFSKRISEIHKKRWQDPEFKKKTVRAVFAALRKKPNKTELKFENFFQRNNFPYKFVGDGTVIIAGKSPDFINTDGQKGIIELFGDYWHKNEKLENGGDDGQARREIFATFGYFTLIVWESELANESKLLKKIMNFHRIMDRSGRFNHGPK